jgi:hypothetical protein
MGISHRKLASRKLRVYLAVHLCKRCDLGNEDSILIGKPDGNPATHGLRHRTDPEPTVTDLLPDAKGLVCICHG